MTCVSLKIQAFFFDMSTQEGGGGIRTSDLRFMRRGPQPIELPLRDKIQAFYRSKEETN
jgi:hypothetical protein